MNATVEMARAEACRGWPAGTRLQCNRPGHDVGGWAWGSGRGHDVAGGHGLRARPRRKWVGIDFGRGAVSSLLRFRFRFLLFRFDDRLRQSLDTIKQFLR